MEPAENEAEKAATGNTSETVNIPVWAGVGAIVVGGALLFVRTKK